MAAASWWRRGGKRAFDIAAAAAGLAVLAVPLIVVGTAIRLVDGPPALYRQVRIGRDGRPFTLLKLRTMRVASDGAGWSTAGDDPRVTRLGRWLRRTSVDELPQLVNVLLGEMSLVGPRPMVPPQAAALPAAARAARHRVRPGITGLAQVSGRSLLDDDARLARDLEYVARHDARLDLAILLATVRVVAAPGEAN